MVDLCIFDPETYMSLVLTEIKNFLEKDITIVSLSACKITLLSLQEHVCKNYL